MAQTKSKRGTTIVRAPHKGDYFIMARSTAQDRNLSFAARGMLTYLLSKPDGWRISIKDLQQGCGRDKVYGLIDELIASRYIERSKSHTTEYVVHEIPLPENTEVNDDNELPEKAEVPSVGELPENTDPDFQDTYILQSIENTEDTENTKTPAVAPQTPSPEQSIPVTPILREVPKNPSKVPAKVPHKLPPQYNDLFVVVRRHSFKGLSGRAVDKRAGALTKALLADDPTAMPIELDAFAQQWPTHLTFPKGEDTLPINFRDWKTNGQIPGATGAPARAIADGTTGAGGGATSESGAGNGQVPKFGPADGTGRKPWERVTKSA